MASTDQLDEMQRIDLHWLGMMLEVWARRVQVLEAGLYPNAPGDGPHPTDH